jgi:hypothetical protein
MWPVWRRVAGELEEDGLAGKDKDALGKQRTDHEFIKRKA